ncbi:MAG: hypothetical protein IJ390_04365 [Lachnospiraceae bacterium]|nr:hypothetical protein [Lachnospiraceae bacterium]
MRKKHIFTITGLIIILSALLWLFAFHNTKRLDNIPSLQLIVQEGEAWGHEKLKGYRREQLIDIWGEPTDAGDENEDIWQFDENAAIRVNYNGKGKVAAIGVMTLTFDPVSVTRPFCEYVRNEDGTWSAEGHTYQYMIELIGRDPNAVKDGRFVVLTNREDVTYEEVSKSLYSSNTKDFLDREETLILEIGAAD